MGLEKVLLVTVGSELAALLEHAWEHCPAGTHIVALP